MTKKRTVVFLLVILMLSFACKRGHEGSAATQSTETIAPASAKPDTSGTEAMTQTVDIEDSRSEAEADDSHSGPTATATVPPATTATTARVPATTTAAVPKPHR